MDITRFIDFKKKKGSINIENAVSSFCKSWNNYYHWIFKINNKNFKDKLSIKKIKNITTYEELYKNIDIPEINFDAIYNLLEFFDNIKNECKEKPDNKINPKAIVDEPNKETTNPKAKTNNPDDIRNEWLEWRSDCFIVNKSNEYEIPENKANQFIDMCFEKRFLNEKDKKLDVFEVDWLFKHVNVVNCKISTVKEYIRRHRSKKKSLLKYDTNTMNSK